MIAVNTDIIFVLSASTASWSVGDLSKELAVGEKHLRAPLIYWINERVLREQTPSGASTLGNSSAVGREVVYCIISDTTEMLDTADGKGFSTVHMYTVQYQVHLL